MKGALLIGGGVLGLLYLASRAKAIKETVQYLEYTPEGIDLHFEGLVPVITVKLNIYNPNRTSVPVDGILGQIRYNGNMVASFTNTERINLNGNESTTVPVKVRLSLFNAAVTLFTKDSNKKLSIDGLIKCSYITDVPFGWSYDFNTKVSSKLKNVAAVGILKKFHNRIREKNARRILRKAERINPALVRPAAAPAPIIDAFSPETFNQSYEQAV